MYDESEDYNDDGYHVESVEQVEPPAGLAGELWHRYVIGRGNSKIEGMKPGSMAEVRQHAQSVADDLNERANKKISTYITRNQKR